MSTQRWPREWLMTDERMGDRLWSALERVPEGGGVVFRHYSLAPEDRLEVGSQVAAIAESRGLLLNVARDPDLAERLGAALVHNPERRSLLRFTRSVHNEAEALAARREGAAIVFVSPLFATHSHPGAPVLGVEEAGRLARLAACPAVALGGMDRTRFEALGGDFIGFAGIDCWLGEQPGRLD